jgi:hypothetical protein
VLGTSAASGQQPRTGLRLDTPTSAARAAVDSFFAGVAAERWTDAARWLDMERFAAFFKQTVSSTRAELPPPKMTVERLMANDSTMPRAVAEWQLSRMRQYEDSEPFNYLSRQFAGIRTQREFFALTPAEAAARWLEAEDPRTIVRHVWRQMKCKTAIPTEMLQHQRPTVLGAVVADSMAYIVVRRLETDSSDAALMIAPEVIVARRTAAGWRVAPQLGLVSGAFGGGAAMGVDGSC